LFITKFLLQQQTVSGDGCISIIPSKSTSTENASAITEDTENDNQELTEEQIQEFITNEQIAASEGNNAADGSVYTPQIGQQFESREQGQHFFHFYAYLAGFKVKITRTTRTTSKKRNGEVYKVEMRCTHSGKAKQTKTTEQEEAELDKEIGKKPVSKRKTSVQEKSDCQCFMLLQEENQIWKIKTLDLDHNHELRPGQRETLFSGHKYMTDMEKALIRTLNDNNIPTRQMVSILSYLRGGPTALPMKKKDISNYRTKINREVKGSDMTKVLDYFRKRHSEDATFFYKIDLDEDQRVRNIFWTDGSCKKYYAQFGDCVSFDTTFMTNRYNLPISPFVGITGHAQSCLFGCAFLQDETIDTFVWLFEAFLEAMGGKHPISIITDQDKAMKAAILKVFTNTRHRNCLFHIKTKCYNKNKKLFTKDEELFKDFEDTVNNSLTVNEFETLWLKMIADKNLENNKYLTKMWEMRNRFIPVYFKNDFFPFIQTTSRSESFNSRMKDNVGPTYSILSFLKEYDRVIDNINRAEKIEDTYSDQKRPKEYIFGYTIEEQAADLYNRNIFRKFQIQLKATTKLSYKHTEEGKQFVVWPKSNQLQNVHRVRRFTVEADLTPGDEEFTCICGKFSKDGILCSHILKIIIEKEINKIPDKYIIDRWRKRNTQTNGQREEEETTASNPVLRHNILSRKSAILNSKGSQTDIAMDYLMSEFDKIEKGLDLILQSQHAGQGENQHPGQGENQYEGGQGENQQQGNEDGQSMAPQQGEEETDTEIQNPVRIKRKGRPPKPKRFKTRLEEIKIKQAEQEKKRIAAEEKKKAAAERKKATEERKKKKKTKDTDSTGKTNIKKHKRLKKALIIQSTVLLQDRQ
jgi:hypothetical protein